MTSGIASPTVTASKSTTGQTLSGLRADDPSPTDHTILRERFERLREKVYARRPVLHEIVQKRGSKKLYEYATEYADVNINQPILRRQDQFLGTFKKEVERNLGAEVAESAVRQLKKYYFVSTADHHGPICHPFFLNANLISSVPNLDHHDPDLQNVIVLSCANVSLNNSSFPRGLLFHSTVRGETKMHRLAFSTCTSRLSPVFNFPASTTADMDRVQKNISEKVRKGEVRREDGDKISALIDEIYRTPEVLTAPSYSDQITRSNFHLWKKFFSPNHATPPNLIYVELETLVSRLLIEHHLGTETTISHLLFHPDYTPLIEKYFDGIMGAFSVGEKYGTYMFWALPKDAKYRIQLWKRGDELVSDDGSYRVKLTPDSIRAALERKELIPSMLISYILLSFYYGIKCLGGFSQVNYLTFMKNAYIKMQADLGEYENIEVCARSQTKELGGDVSIAFISDSHGKLIPATGLDLILYGTENTWRVLVEQSKLISIEEALNPLMPDFYRIIYTEKEREDDLASITSEDITKITGLSHKVAGCAALPSA